MKIGQFYFMESIKNICGGLGVFVCVWVFLLVWFVGLFLCCVVLFVGLFVLNRTELK